LNQDGFADFILGGPSRNPVDSFIIFGSAGLGGMTQTGSTGADNLLGGTFNDTITGGGGADNILTFQGNDIIIVPDLLSNFIDGGAGTDTLRFAGSGGSHNLSTLAAGVITDIEQIDLVAGSSANTLTVTQQSLLGLSSTSDLLKVFGDSADKVIATGFATGSTTTEKGITYNIYTNGTATLWVQQGVQVEGAVPPSGFVAQAISWADQSVLAG
jgi:Ca2+-binding RTX toxin-like protein